jgi:Stage II sporulation protein E (SpoIIE)
MKASQHFGTMPHLSRELMEGAERSTFFDLELAGASRPVTDLLDGYLDWLKPSPGELAFLIGERAAMCDTGLVSNSLILHYFQTAVSQEAPAPRRLAFELNDLVCNVWESKSIATCFYAHYTSSSKILRFVNAGHHPPLLIRSNPFEVFRLDQGGPSLGLWNTTRFTEGAVQLKAGDRLLAFTRGVIEAWASEEDIKAEAAMVRILRNSRNDSAARIAESIVGGGPMNRRVKLDKIAIVASLGSAGSVASRELAEQQTAEIAVSI